MVTTSDVAGVSYIPVTQAQLKDRAFLEKYSDGQGNVWFVSVSSGGRVYNNTPFTISSILSGQNQISSSRRLVTTYDAQRIEQAKLAEEQARKEAEARAEAQRIDSAFENRVYTDVLDKAGIPQSEQANVIYNDELYKALVDAGPSSVFTETPQGTYSVFTDTGSASQAMSAQTFEPVKETIASYEAQKQAEEKAQQDALKQFVGEPTYTALTTGAITSDSGLVAIGYGELATPKALEALKISQGQEQFNIQMKQATELQGLKDAGYSVEPVFNQTATDVSFMVTAPTPKELTLSQKESIFQTVNTIENAKLGEPADVPNIIDKIQYKGDELSGKYLDTLSTKQGDINSYLDDKGVSPIADAILFSELTTVSIAKGVINTSGAVLHPVETVKGFAHPVEMLKDIDQRSNTFGGAVEVATEFYLFGKMVSPITETVKFSKVEVPTVEGKTTIYRGISLEYGNKAQPLIGVSELSIPKVLYEGPKVIKVGTPEINLNVIDLKKGYIPETATQTAVIKKGLPTIYDKIEVQKFELGTNIISKTENVKSAFIQDQFIKQTQTLKPAGVTEVLKFTEENQGQLYGSFSARSQIPTEIWEKYRGDKAPADIDVQLNMSELKTIELTKKLNEKLKLTGEDTRISSESPTLIEVKTEGGTYRHAVDIHSKDISLSQLKASDVAGEKALGFKMGKDSIKIEDVKTMPLGEQGIRKGASIFTLREEGLGPKAHRLKDIPDFFQTQETLAKSKRIGSDRVMSDIDKLKKLYPEDTFKVEKSAGKELIADFSKSEGMKSPSISFKGMGATVIKPASPSMKNKEVVIFKELKSYTQTKEMPSSKNIYQVRVKSSPMIKSVSSSIKINSSKASDFKTNSSMSPASIKVNQINKSPSFTSEKSTGIFTPSSSIYKSQSPYRSPSPSPSPYTSPSPSPYKSPSPSPSPSPYTSPSPSPYKSPSPSPSPSPYTSPSPSPYRSPSPSPSPYTSPSPSPYKSPSPSPTSPSPFKDIPIKSPTPFIVPVPSPSPKKTDKVEGYNVYMKEDKKRVKANERPLPKSEAMRLGRDIADNSLSASFYISKTKQRVPQATRSKLAMGGNVPESKFHLNRKGEYIEQNRSRLDTFGEKSGIKASKLISQRKKDFMQF